MENEQNKQSKPEWLEGKVNYFGKVEESEDKKTKYQRVNITLSSDHTIMLNVGESLISKNSSVQQGDYVKFAAYADDNAKNKILVKSEDQKNIYGFNLATPLQKTNERSTSISSDMDGKPVRIIVAAGADGVSSEFQGSMRTNVSAYIKQKDIQQQDAKDQLVTVKSGPKFHDQLKDVKKGDILEIEGYVKITQKESNTYTDIQVSKKPQILYKKDQQQEQSTTATQEKPKAADKVKKNTALKDKPVAKANTAKKPKEKSKGMAR